MTRAEEEAEAVADLLKEEAERRAAKWLFPGEEIPEQCPACHKPLLDQAKGICWQKKCDYRRCAGCGRSTGSPFIVVCDACGRRDADGEQRTA